MSFINKEKEIVEKIMMCILILSFKGTTSSETKGCSTK